MGRKITIVGAGQAGLQLAGVKGRFLRVASQAQAGRHFGPHGGMVGLVPADHFRVVAQIGGQDEFFHGASFPGGGKNAIPHSGQT